MSKGNKARMSYLPILCYLGYNSLYSSNFPKAKHQDHVTVDFIES
jgi:hypothetical protein